MHLVLRIRIVPHSPAPAPISLNGHTQDFHGNFFKKILFIYLFFILWLCWVFVSVQGLSLVAASGGHSSSRCAGLSLSRPLLLRSTGSRRAGSAIVAHGLSFSAACGIFPDQGSNPCPLHWQADSQPLRHQGSPSWKLLSLLHFSTIQSWLHIRITLGDLTSIYLWPRPTTGNSDLISLVYGLGIGSFN